VTAAEARLHERRCRQRGHVKRGAVGDEVRQGCPYRRVGDLDDNLDVGSQGVDYQRGLEVAQVVRFNRHHGPASRRAGVDQHFG
jgi:hypothetical protein